MAPKPRQASVQFLQKVFGRKPTGWEVARHFFSFSSTILDRVFFLTDQLQQFDIQFHNREIILENTGEGHGCLLFGSHLGSFEVMRALASEHQLDVKVLMYREQTQKIASVFDALNPDMANSVIPLGKSHTMIMAYEFVQAGGALGMLCDRSGVDDKFTECDFLGEKAIFPTGPAILAAAMKVPVIMIFGIYRGGNHYDVYFELLTRGLSMDRKDRATQINKVMQQYADTVEKYARMAPYNWFNFYDFWNKP